ncbi:MAG TPA: carboxypeptidase regulatory-like domain-containing protein, partial [Anaeromyxobacter sp.]|nr:carboxypeptidase regulatory-like domain-containing protein [Anaeromyxobacter sp.]
MRVRPVPLLVAVFGSAVAVTVFVVRQLPREGEVSPPERVPVAVAPAESSPPLERPAAAADGVVEVRVTAGGEPQAGAEVRLYLAPDADGAPWRRAGDAWTEAAGVARLPAGPGAYLVAARVVGLAPARAGVVRPSDRGTVRVALAAEPPAALEGRAMLRTGEPAARARVRAIPVSSLAPAFASASAPPEEIAVGEADVRGGLRLDGLSPGTWSVAIDMAGHHPVVLPRLRVPGPPIAAMLEPLGFVQGRVLHPDGRPAAAALVRAASADHGATARAGPDGRFGVAAPAGSYVVTACLGEGAAALERRVSVAAGATTDPLELRLGPAATLHGAIRGPGGAPVAGGQVALLAHDTRELVGRAVSGRDGRFEVRGLAPGAYDVRASSPGTSPAWLRGVTVAPGARFPLRVSLPAAGAIAGTVRDPAGRALAGVHVRAAVRGDGVA